jgi:hypothetical protein
MLNSKSNATGINVVKRNILRKKAWRSLEVTYMQKMTCWSTCRAIIVTVIAYRSIITNGLLQGESFYFSQLADACVRNSEFLCGSCQSWLITVHSHEVANWRHQILNVEMQIEILNDNLFLLGSYRSYIMIMWMKITCFSEYYHEECYRKLFNDLIMYQLNIVGNFCLS